MRRPGPYVYTRSIQQQSEAEGAAAPETRARRVDARVFAVWFARRSRITLRVGGRQNRRSVHLDPSLCMLVRSREFGGEITEYLCHCKRFGRDYAWG